MVVTQFELQPMRADVASPQNKEVRSRETRNHKTLKNARQEGFMISVDSALTHHHRLEKEKKPVGTNEEDAKYSAKSMCKHYEL